MIELFDVGSSNTGTGLPLRDAFVSVQTNLQDLQNQLLELGVGVDEVGTRTPYTIFVATDGDDTNNGHSFGEPFATLEQAIEEAWAIHEAESNVRVLIKVAPGNYTLSNLPYRVPAFTSIMGDSLRSVTLFPATGEERNGFFKVDDGFYMWGLTFRGHQADTAKTGWIVQLDDEADNTSRGANGLGAYITASPYFQNCSSITAEDDSGFAPSLSTGDTGGGIYVNGNACASNSPLRSIVLDSFTQINLDGVGCLVENDAYAQLVSFFGTFCRYHVLCRTGGQVNFTGGTTDFGTYGLVADGYSPEPVYTAVAKRDHYGVARTQQSFTVTAGNLLTKAGHGLVNDALLSVKSATSKPIQPTLDPGERYYVVNATTDTIQVAATAGGTPLVLSTGTAYTDTIDIVNQGELEVDLVNFSTPRYGTASVPTAGMLAFPVLTFPRTGSLAAGATTLGTVSNVEQDGSVYTAVAILDTAPASVGKHEYTRLSGSVTVTRAGAFVTPSGFTIETTPIAGLNTYTFTVTDIDYDHLTGITKFKATDYLPNALDEFYFTDCEFICPLSALVVLGSEPINQFGQGVPEGSPTAVGRQINVYNTINGGLQYSITQGQKLQFRRRSQISAPAHVFEYVGSGTNYSALPENGGIPKQANAYQELNNGKVFLSWTNEKGDFGVSNRFLVDGTTGEVTINATSFNLSGLNAIGPFSRNGGFTTVGVALREVSNNISMNSSLGFPGDDTAPTQEAVVGYVTNILSGETQFEAIFINGVVIFAVGSSAEYPITRPNGQALQAGDILWDATAQDWVRYDGSDWTGEIKAIVRGDGLGGYITNYEFRSNLTPVRPDGLPLQDGDRWENVGIFSAIRDNNLWKALTPVAISLYGSASVSGGWSTYSPPSGVANAFFKSGTAYVGANGYLYSSIDKGQTWSQVYPTQLPATNGVIWAELNGTIIFGTNAHTNLFASGNLYRSTDGGTTWTVMSYPSSSYANAVLVWNNQFVYFPGAATNTFTRVSSDGITWTSPGTQNITFNMASPVVLDNGTVVASERGTGNIYYTTDLVNWTIGGNIEGYNLARGLQNAFYGLGNDIVFNISNIIYISSDYGVTRTQIFSGVNYVPFGRYFDGTYIASAQYGSSIYVTPFLQSSIPSTVSRLDYNVELVRLQVTYKLKSGQSANHNAGNYFTANIAVTNVDTGVVTTYAVVLNNPYPSANSATVYTELTDVCPVGATVKLNSLTNVGAPNAIDVLISLKGVEIYV